MMLWFDTIPWSYSHKYFIIRQKGMPGVPGVKGHRGYTGSDGSKGMNSKCYLYFISN